MLNSLINEYKEFSVNNATAIEKSKKIQLEYTKILDDSIRELSALSFFKRLFPGKKGKEIKNLKQFILEETNRLKQLESSDYSKRQHLFKTYVNQLIYADDTNKLEYGNINARITKVNELYNTINDTVKAGSSAVKEIEEAISAIDSAETSETLDLISSNKAFSIMSSIDSSSARTETNEAVDAVNKFKKQLAFTKIKIDELKFDDSWMTLDFIFDMTDIGGGFMGAYSSFMALQSLGNTKQKLYDAESKVKAVLNPIKKDFEEIKKQKQQEETVLNNFMENFKIQAKVQLKERDINI